MAIEDRDFIMRQVKTLAQGLGTFLSRKTLKDLLVYHDETSAKLSDAEIEVILLVTEVSLRATERGLSVKQLASQLNFTPAHWQEILAGSVLPTPDECAQLEKFLAV